MKLKYCQEEIPFEQALNGLVEVGMENILVNELGKALLYQKNFDIYQVPKPDKARIRELVQEFLTLNRIKDHEALGHWLKEKQQSRQALVKRLVYQEQLQILKRLVIPSNMIQDEFLKRKHQMDWVLFSLIQVAQESLIWELYYQIKDDGQDFEQLARQYSTLPGAVYGGLEEPAQIDSLNPDLKQRLIVLKSGHITEPFTLDGRNFNIARLMRIHSTQLTPPLESRMREELFAEWTTRQLAMGNLKLESVAQGVGQDDAKELSWL
jgi:parvulin-like peptidyl-prolyl isomerase